DALQESDDVLRLDVLKNLEARDHIRNGVIILAVISSDVDTCLPVLGLVEPHVALVSEIHGAENDRLEPRVFEHFELELAAVVVVHTDILERSDTVGQHHASHRNIDAAADVENSSLLVLVLLQEELAHVRPADAVTHIVTVNEDAILSSIDRKVGIVDTLATDVSHSYLLSRNEKAHPHHVDEGGLGREMRETQPKG